MTNEGKEEGATANTENKNEDEPAAQSAKIKASKSSCAGWLTRSLDKFNEEIASTVALEAMKDRIAIQLKKLQAHHNAYITAVEDDDEEVNAAEEWMQGYFDRATDILNKIDQRIMALSSAVVKSELQANAAGVTSQQSNPQPGSSQATSSQPDVRPKTNVSQGMASSAGAGLENPSALAQGDGSSQEEDFDGQDENYGGRSASDLNPTAAEFQPNYNSSASFGGDFVAIDQWIDNLTIGVETEDLPSSSPGNMTQSLAALSLERDLPKIELPVFDGSALAWPKFVEQFFVQVHSRSGLKDSRRMDLLQSHVRGEAKTVIQGLGYSGRNYAMALQELKFAFGHRVKVARACIGVITSGNPLQSGDSVGLRNFYISVRDCVNTLQMMNYVSEINSGEVLLKATKRIPNEKRGKWNEYVRRIYRVREPTLLDLQRWLKDCVESDISPYAITFQPSKTQNVTRSSHQRTSFNTVTDSLTVDRKKCPICQDAHHVSRCKQYLDKSLDQRYEFVKANRLCFNCLYLGHRIADCKSTTTCKAAGCKTKHHTTLHRSRSNNSSEVRVNNLQRETGHVYFQVVPVVINGKNGRNISTYAMLDSASDVTLISSELADELGLHGRRETLVVNTVNSASSMSSECVSFSIKASCNQDAETLWIKEAWTKAGHFQCPVVPTTDLRRMRHLRDINLCDFRPNDVKLLIGANVPRAHIQIDCREGQLDEPIAIETLLGWCVMGPSSASSMLDAHVNLINTQDLHLDRQVEQFWSTESFGVSATLVKPTSVEDIKSLNVLESQTTFVNGHYQVPMLWRDDCVKLQDNRQVAERRFNSLQKRLSADSGFREKYSSVVNGYIDSGYARELTVEEVSLQKPRVWYLPHHGVTNPNKPGKVRVVFDAAADCKGGSLNSHLMTGPDLTNNLFTVIQRFRINPVALVADVAEMFHQVAVRDEDSDALRFLWKRDVSIPGPPMVYKMLVHIFGAKDSPCCANYALRQAATGLKSDVCDEVRHTILNNFYVDDMLKSVPDVPSAIKLAGEMTETLALHGFKLTKWMSSSREVIASLPLDLRAKPDLDLDLEQLPVERALGIRWDVERDSFFFVPVMKDVTMTKRGIISAVSSIFDPCGFLSPFTFTAKRLIQDIWREDLQWDDVIPGTLQQRWRTWYDDLPYLKDLHIPRYYGYIPGMETELHLFCDASEGGFASVAFVRMTDSRGLVTCSFLAGKTHVSPVKNCLTIPKLELQGAVMAVRLSSALKDEFGVGFCKTIFWTDAITVLRYINNERRRWKIFVANRITEIREDSEPGQWRYVPSKLNPADCATRGLSAADLNLQSMWLRGPDFLWQNQLEWPAQPDIQPPKDDDENLKKININLTAGRENTGFMDGICINKIINPKLFSSWFRLMKHTAWVLRAVRNFAARSSKYQVQSVSGVMLSRVELRNAELAMVRSAQQESLAKEFQQLQAGKNIDSRSSILCLNPFFSSENVICVGGRLRKATDLEVCHQIILPYDHHVTRLILNDVHLKTAHGGPEHMIAEVRLQYWPIKCRQLAKGIVHDCMDCRRHTVTPKPPIMADLPVQRITAGSKPFEFTGLDYFGPIMVKRGRSRLKRWGCIFTCLVTRAVHIELADSLETDDFILVLRCFVSRRGQPVQLFSDNGTNFRGADRELRENLQGLDQSMIQNYMMKYKIDWKFITPHAPHFGGAWERLIKSVKRALSAILKDQCVTESVLRTTLAEVEAVVNGRPLTYNSSSINDYTALTPNHFLHGGATHIAPIGDFDSRELCSRKRWRQTQVLADHAWKRWLREYLPSLTVRSKWQTQAKNLKTDDLVMIMEDNIPRGQWLLGRVVEVVLSDDDCVRSLRIKTKHGTYARPASKVCLLEESIVNNV